jgi:2'-5' RNA ligase
MAFPNNQNPKVYALTFSDTSELERLQKKLTDLVDISTYDVSRPFRPHITLMRLKNLDDRFKDSAEIFSKIEPFGVKVSEFGLYKSEPEKGLNKYTPLKVISLK